MSGSGRCRTSCSRHRDPERSAQDAFPLSCLSPFPPPSRWPSVQPLPLTVLPALHENPITPDGSRFEPAGTSGFLPSPTQPESNLQTLPADFLHPEIADPDLDRISPPATIVWQAQAGNRDRAASEISSLPWLYWTRGTVVPPPRRSRSTRPWRNTVFSVRDGFDQLAAPECRQLGEPVWMLLRNQGREFASVLHAGDHHGACLHPIAAGPSCLQGLRGVPPLYFRIAAASFRKSPGSVVASLHSWNRIVRIRCPWSLFLHRRVPGRHAFLTGCAFPRPTRLVRSGPYSLSDRLSYSWEDPMLNGRDSVPGAYSIFHEAQLTHPKMIDVGRCWSRKFLWRSTDPGTSRKPKESVPSRHQRRRSDISHGLWADVKIRTLRTAILRRTRATLLLALAVLCSSGVDANAKDSSAPRSEVERALRARITGGAVFSNGRAVVVLESAEGPARFESPQFGQASSYLAFEAQPHMVVNGEDDHVRLDSIVNVRLTTIPVIGAASSELSSTGITATDKSILQSQKAVQVQLGAVLDVRFEEFNVGDTCFSWSGGPIYRIMFQSITDDQRTVRIWNIDDDLYSAHIVGGRLALNQKTSGSDPDWTPTAYLDISAGWFQNFEIAKARVGHGDHKRARKCLEMPADCLTSPPAEDSFTVEKNVRLYIEGRIFFKYLFLGFDLNNGAGYDDLRLMAGVTVPLSTFFSNED